MAAPDLETEEKKRGREAEKTFSSTPNSPYSLDNSVRVLKGVGPQAMTALEKLNLRTIGDLLRHIPRRWEDRTDFRRVADVQSGEFVTVCGRVIAVTTTYPKPKMAITKVLLDDDGAALTLTWFNQSFLERTFNALKLASKPDRRVWAGETFRLDGGDRQPGMGRIGRGR